MGYRWTLEKLKHLKDELKRLKDLKNLEAQVSPTAKIVIFKREPWSAQLHLEGVAEPHQVTVDELTSAGVSKEEAEQWIARTQRAVETLNRLLPTAEKAEQLSFQLSFADMWMEKLHNSPENNC